MIKSILSVVAITLFAVFFAAPSYALPATPVVSQSLVPISGSFNYQPVAGCDPIVFSISCSVNVTTVAFTAPQNSSSGRQVIVLSNLAGVKATAAGYDLVGYGTERFSPQPQA